MTLWYECSIIKIESIIKRYSSWQRRKRCPASNNLLPQAAELHWPGQCVSIVYRQGGLAPSGRLCVAQHTWDEGQGCLDETCATRGSSQVHYCTLHINAYYCILLHYCTLHQCIVVVLLGYFQLNENRSLGREHQLHPVRLGMLIIFTRAADCISMENAHRNMSVK